MAAGTGRRKRRRRFRRLGMAAQNALELVRAGRLGSRYGAPYHVVHTAHSYRLRHYEAVSGARGPGPRAPLLLVPPLMVASEIYDIDPEISAVGALTRAGVDVWMVDYGAPEREEGGMSRTLDDHVLAVSDAIDRVRDAAGHDVHLAGYSQGGMFAYQAAAFRRSEGLASLITFGSPVDIHRNLPAVRDDFAQRFIGAARTMIALPLARTGGLPGRLTSTGFKLLSARKEVQQFIDFLSKLHDRQALEKRESRRLFLGGEGFVAWPGPALRTFVDEVIVHNRMASGGFVIDGRPVTLADIRCPILYVVGLRDDMARPPSVRAIERAAPEAEIHGLELKAGHFGLVVGSTAQTITWPTVIDWLRWRIGEGSRPAALPETAAHGAEHDEDYDAGFDDFQFDLELAYDVVAKAASAAWSRVGDLTEDASDAIDNLRWQVPRLRKLRRLEPDSRISLGRELASKARSMGDRTFFIWNGRAFSYQDANRRVDNVVRGLIQRGVRPGMRVGVLMQVRPSYLSIVGALSRLGAVAVLINPTADDNGLRATFDLARPEVLVADPELAARARRGFVGDILVLGGGPRRSVPDGVIDMETIDPEAVRLPAWYKPDRGRADDVAMIIVGTGRTGAARAAQITNRRWAFSAYGAAAACTLTPKDTVYSCLPLHHAAGALVGAGGALVGGARLALSPSFRADEFWPEVRRYGATVVFYAGEMCRALVDAPHAPGERNNPVRLFAGSGMRVDVWRRLIDRFGPLGVLEFYASTEGNAVLANAAGDKVGALGRPLPGSSQLVLVEVDLATGELVRDADGRGRAVGVDEPGLLLSRIDAIHPLPGGAAGRLIRDVFAPGDSWLVSGDLLRRDADGDFWWVDRVVDAVRTTAGPAWTTAIEDALYRVPAVRLAVAYGQPDPDSANAEIPCASVALRDGATLDPVALLRAVEDALPRHAWPRVVRIADDLPLTPGYWPLKSPHRRAPIGAAALHYDPDRHAYA